MGFGVKSRICRAVAAVQPGNSVEGLPADIGELAPDYWIVISIERDRPDCIICIRVKISICRAVAAVQPGYSVAGLPADIAVIATYYWVAVSIDRDRQYPIICIGIKSRICRAVAAVQAGNIVARLPSDLREHSSCINPVVNSHSAACWLSNTLHSQCLCATCIVFQDFNFYLRADSCSGTVGTSNRQVINSYRAQTKCSASLVSIVTKK